MFYGTKTTFPDFVPVPTTDTQRASGFRSPVILYTFSLKTNQLFTGPGTYWRKLNCICKETKYIGFAAFIFLLCVQGHRRRRCPRFARSTLCSCVCEVCASDQRAHNTHLHTHAGIKVVAVRRWRQNRGGGGGGVAQCLCVCVCVRPYVCVISHNGLISGAWHEPKSRHNKHTHTQTHTPGLEHGQTITCLCVRGGGRGVQTYSGQVTDARRHILILTRANQTPTHTLKWIAQTHTHIQ